MTKPIITGITTSSFVPCGEIRLAVTTPFTDLCSTHSAIREELLAAIARVLDSGQYIGGRELEDFEREFAEYCGTTHCLGVGNGLDALHLALRALGIGSGDEVLVPAHTFIATWLAVTWSGATPIPVDADRHTMNLDPDTIEESITERTRAIIPVHLYGTPAAMGKIVAIARANDLKVIEDAAQAHGSEIDGRRIGSFGDVGAFSFYPTKNLGALGDGGALVSNDAQVIDRARTLANYGSRDKYQHDTVGINSRLDPMQAAILRVKMKHIDGWNRHRQRLANVYLDALQAVDDLTLPSCGESMSPVWHQFVVRHRERDGLRRQLADRGIPTLVHYPSPPYVSKIYAGGDRQLGDFPVSDEICASIVSLPMGVHLTEEDIQHVVACVMKACTT